MQLIPSRSKGFRPQLRSRAQAAPECCLPAESSQSLVCCPYRCDRLDLACPLCVYQIDFVTVLDSAGVKPPSSDSTSLRIDINRSHHHECRSLFVTFH